jgi:cytochrome P450
MTASARPAIGSFLAEVEAVEQQTPVPAPTDPAFAAAAKARGGAVGQVVSRWLAARPYDMLQELLDQPADTHPIFKPAIGPVVVMRHRHVLTCLERTDLFTVDPYAGEMARATDDRGLNPQAFSHFMLGTDRDELYRLDDVIMRRAVSRDDEPRLTALIREEAERWTGAARAGGQNEIDIVTTLARFVPLRIVTDYLGVPSSEAGQPSVIPGRRGGDTFPIADSLRQVFVFSKIDSGIVPTSENLFTWIKDAFRNTFNNFDPTKPLFATFRERGLIATEYLAAYLHELIAVYKGRLASGEPVPDTMLTRLLRLQRRAAGRDGEVFEQECAAMLGLPLPAGELARRLSDSMIRSNVFGTAVGGVVNPQEATARLVDSMLRLKDGEYRVLNGSSYQDAARLAAVDERDPGYADSLRRLRHYALEALRLKPQGEVLLRACVQDNTELGGILVRKGTPVFVAFAAAMRDPEAIVDPLAFDVERDERLEPYRADGERAREAPQSRVYLQHGYGRHKCLGRYASELTMRESLRAVLRLGQLERRGPLEMDEQGLYAERLRVGFVEGEVA